MAENCFKYYTTFKYNAKNYLQISFSKAWTKVLSCLFTLELKVQLFLRQYILISELFIKKQHNGHDILTDFPVVKREPIVRDAHYYGITTESYVHLVVTTDDVIYTVTVAISVYLIAILTPKAKINSLWNCDRWNIKQIYLMPAWDEILKLTNQNIGK